jgi:hypothetical protein
LLFVALPPTHGREINRKGTSSSLVGIASTLVFAAVLLTPTSASARTEPPTPPPSGESTVYVDPDFEGTTVDRATLPDTKTTVSPEIAEKLEEIGLTGPVLTVQEGENGMGTFYADEEAWVLDLGPVPTKGGISTQAFSYGFCTGYFNTPAHVSNYLQWGGQSSCSASNGQYYLHRVTAALYDTCIGPFCVILTYRATATSPSSSNFNRVATAYGARTCNNGNGRTYEQKVNVTVRSVAYGPYWQRGVVVNTCSVAP